MSDLTRIKYQEIGELFEEGDMTDIAMEIENKIINEVCKEDNKNMQFIIPYDKSCVQYGIEHNPPNSWNLQDTIRNYLCKRFSIKDEDGNVEQIETL